jgi:hypothetical protein
MNAAKVRSGWSSKAGTWPVALRSAVAPLVALATLAASAAAAAEPLADQLRSRLQRHGMVARHFWAPGLTSTEVAGMRLSAGLAVGVRAPLRAAVGAAVAPAIVLHTGPRSNLTLLAADQGGALLVWQLRH